MLPQVPESWKPFQINQRAGFPACEILEPETRSFQHSEYQYIPALGNGTTAIPSGLPSRLSFAGTEKSLIAVTVISSTLLLAIMSEQPCHKLA